MPFFVVQKQSLLPKVPIFETQKNGHCGLLGLHQSKASLPSPELALFSTCKQMIINCNYWVCLSITCSAQRKAHLLPQDSHQTSWSSSVSSWAWRATPVLPSGSDILRVLEYYFLQTREYWFLVCRLYGDYPAKECHHYWRHKFVGSTCTCTLLTYTFNICENDHFINYYCWAGCTLHDLHQRSNFSQLFVLHVTQASRTLILQTLR